MDPELDEGSRIDQPLEPFPCGELLGGMLGGDLLGPAALPYLFPPGSEVVGERAQQAGGGSVGGHSRKWNVLLTTVARHALPRQGEALLAWPGYPLIEALADGPRASSAVSPVTVTVAPSPAAMPGTVTERARGASISSRWRPSATRTNTA